MRKLITFLLLVTQLSQAENIRNMEPENFYKIDNALKNSDHVVRATIKSKRTIKSKNRLCKIEVFSVFVSESFKGHIKTGNTVEFVYAQGRQTQKTGSNQLLFLSSFKNDYPTDFKYCDKEEYEGVLRANSECCSLKEKDGEYLIMNHEVTSNDMSEWYLVEANETFEKLRTQK